MAETAAQLKPVLNAAAPDPRVARSQTDILRFGTLLIPLALLLVTFRVYSLEQPAFFSLACLIFGGFAVSYWLPFRFKETFVVLLSIVGAFVLLAPMVASLLIAATLALFGIVRSSLSFRWKIFVFSGILAGLMYCRATGRLPVPSDFWPVFGAIFMFRMIVYLYDLKHTKEPPRLKDFLSYFLLLPNYYFLLFPVVDFRTFRQSYFKRDIHTVARQGVWWITRGTTQLLLYRVIYQLQSSFSPPKVPVAVAVVVKVVSSYLIYLRITGQFHIIAGMLCLFGYDMPETNRRFLLASSLTDFWRRANIYWKDFMVKIFYFPAYFKLRRRGDFRARLLATAFVFVVTWALHGYQFFWLQGTFRITYNDTIFWSILGILVVAEVWITEKRPKRLPAKGWAPRVRKCLQIAAMFTLISILWSMWSANTLTQWFDLLRTGNT